jgi:hypothetical protein
MANTARLSSNRPIFAQSNSENDEQFAATEKWNSPATIAGAIEQALEMSLPHAITPHPCVCRMHYVRTLHYIIGSRQM